MTVLERLSELGITLPAVAAPVAAYVPAIRVGDQVWTSGQLPFVDGKLPAVGKLGADITVEQGADYARQAALNALAAVDALVGINNVKRVLKIVGGIRRWFCGTTCRRQWCLQPYWGNFWRSRSSCAVGCWGC